MSDYPCISVVMPVYNAGKFVREAIQSILDQSYPFFEFIIINDGSTDNSLEIIQSFTDNRIKILSNPTNIGNYPSRNKGMGIAKGKYIYVMDADDVALKQRLERQYLFMEEHPAAGLAGSGFRYYGNEQDIFRESNYERIKVILLRNNCFIHPTLILRNDFLKKYNLRYNKKYYYSADYDLIVRAARHFHITNIPEVLLHYRVHDQQITVKNRTKQKEYADEITIEQLKYLGIDPDETETSLHISFLNGNIIEYSKKQKLYEWINKIKKANQNKKSFGKEELDLLFISLLSRQSFCCETERITVKNRMLEKNDKIDLADVTFLIPVKIDSHQRIENTNVVVKFITRYFKTDISILETDIEQRYFLEKKQPNVHYRFIEDQNETYNKAYYVNWLISMTNSSFLVVWDADAIVSKEQIIDGLDALKSGKSIISLPYDGRVYSVNEPISRLFREKLSFEILISSIPVFKLMHGYFMTGGIYMVNRNNFIEHGGENEKILGWGFEDAERLKRMETMDLLIYYSKGPLFHLWHPRGKNSWFANREIEKNNRKEFLKTCSFTN